MASVIDREAQLVADELGEASKIVRLTGTKIADLRSPSHVHNISAARQIVIYLLRREFGWSLTRIGRYINRDHTSVHHAIKKVEADEKLHRGAIKIQADYERAKQTV